MPRIICIKKDSEDDPITIGKIYEANEKRLGSVGYYYDVHKLDNDKSGVKRTDKFIEIIENSEKIQIGSIVKSLEVDKSKNFIGVVVCSHPQITERYGIIFDESFKGHDLRSYEGLKQGWYVYQDKLKLVNNKGENNMINEIMLNGKKITVFGEENYQEIGMYLKNTFKDHGEFYKDVFGVDEKSALDLGWHPYDNEFNDDCDGWDRFIKAKGLSITKKENYDDLKEHFIKNIF